MVLKKLKPGMTVYDVRKMSGLETFHGKWKSYTVSIIEINEENNMVLASWNSNKAKWYIERTWSKWRMNLPKEVGNAKGN